MIGDYYWFLQRKTSNTHKHMAQLTGAAEYTDFISAEG